MLTQIVIFCKINMKKTPGKRHIKKYQNRRLYDTATSTYIILDDIKQMIVEGDSVTVTDVKTGADVTRSVLLQIILEEEANSTPIFSNEFLLQIIRFYGKSFQSAISPFLEQSIDVLRQTQKKFYAQLKATYPKDALPSGIEMWKAFLNDQGPLIQQNIFDYLNSSTNNFFQMQEQMQEQINSQTEKLINLMQFPFNSKDKE